LEAIAASAAADATDALDEDEHLPRDDEIIHDLLGLVDDDGGLASSDDESSDDESIFQRPMATSRIAEQLLSPLHPVDLGINPYNDDVDVEGDGMLAHDGMLAKPMPSLDAGVLLCAAPNVAGADAATPEVAPRLTSGQIQQRQERDCDMAVANLSYKQRLETARARIASKIGHKVTVKQGSGRQEKEIEWEVIEERVSTEENEQDREYIGLTGLDLESIDDEVIFARIFLHLFCEDMGEMKARANVAIAEKNHTKRFSLGEIKPFSASELIVGLALMIGGGEAGGNGCMIWRSERKRQEKVFQKSILRIPDFEEFGMPYWRFEQFRKFSPSMWEKKEMEGIDEWWQGISMTDEFNNRRKKVISASQENTADESMCAMRPRTTKLGGWPHISYILSKPEPLGTEFKNTCCSITGALITLEIQRAKQHTPNLKYNRKFGATTGVCLRLIKSADPEDGLKECIKGDAWFGSVRACAALGGKGHKAFLQIKGNKGIYPKIFIEEQMAATPSGTSILMKGTHPNGFPLITIGYRYSTRTTLFFVMTEDAGE
jgi:hypothetical protein